MRRKATGIAPSGFSLILLRFNIRTAVGAGGGVRTCPLHLAGADRPAAVGAGGGQKVGPVVGFGRGRGSRFRRGRRRKRFRVKRVDGGRRRLGRPFLAEERSEQHEQADQYKDARPPVSVAAEEKKAEQGPPDPAAKAMAAAEERGTVSKTFMSVHVDSYTGKYTRGCAKGCAGYFRRSQEKMSGKRMQSMILATMMNSQVLLENLELRSRTAFRGSCGS